MTKVFPIISEADALACAAIAQQDASSYRYYLSEARWRRKAADVTGDRSPTSIDALIAKDATRHAHRAARHVRALADALIAYRTGQAARLTA